MPRGYCIKCKAIKEMSEVFDKSPAKSEKFKLLLGTCKECGQRMSKIVVASYSKEVMTGLIRYFRSLGFFQKYSKLTEEEIIEELLHGPSENPLSLLVNDEERIWSADAKVWDFLNPYTKALKALGHISRGAFQPTNIKEEWIGGNEGHQIQIDFELDGTSHRLFLKNDIYYDLNLFKSINKLIVPTGYSFEWIDQGDPWLTIVVLTPDEKTRLEQEKGFKFLTFLK